MIIFSNTEMRYIYSSLCTYRNIEIRDDNAEINNLVEKVRQVILHDIPIGEIKEGEVQI